MPTPRIIFGKNPLPVNIRKGDFHEIKCDGRTSFHGIHEKLFPPGQLPPAIEKSKEARQYLSHVSMTGRPSGGVGVALVLYR